MFTTDMKNTINIDARFGFPPGIIRQHWNDAEKISAAPAQG